MTLETAGCITFYKELAEQQITPYIEDLKEFFGHPQVQQLINNNKYESLFESFIISGAIFCSLLLAGIDFLPYLSHIKHHFGGLQGTGVIYSINVPESIEFIEYEAFSSQGNLEYITFPASLKSIGGGAFAYTGLCMQDNKQRVIFQGTRKEWENMHSSKIIFNSVSRNYKIQVGVYCSDGVSYTY